MLSCNAQTKKPDLLINKDDNTLLWQISGNELQKPSYLFGTFHLMCKKESGVFKLSLKKISIFLYSSFE